MHTPTSKKKQQALRLERLENMQCRLDLMYAKLLHEKNNKCYVIRYSRWIRQRSTGRAYSFTVSSTKVEFIPRAVVFEHNEQHAVMVIGPQFIQHNRCGIPMSDMLDRLYAISVPGGVICPSH